MAKYREKNKDKIERHRKEFYKRNPGKMQTYRETHRQKFGSKEGYKAYLKSLYYKRADFHRQRKREEYAKDKEKVLLRNSLYSKSERGRDVRKVLSEKRRNMEAGLKNYFTADDWATCKNSFINKRGQNVCAYCGIASELLTMDHVIPVISGGGLIRSNIVPACKSCNCSKRENDFSEWYPKQEFYSQEREQKIINYLNKNMNIWEAEL
ncbi:MAG: hypothetical protein HPY66_1668 [Firmicutes bacterium]|nr:hypothetical protein [Bacillota bacterium]